MSHFIDYFVPPHDPILGIKPGNLADHLHLDNWQSKAITLKKGKASLYVYLCKAVSPKRHKHYFSVNVYDVNTRATLSRRLFTTPEEALGYVINVQTPSVNLPL